MKKVHLISNAHLDPVWLWEWEEGAAEAISTFRIAADFCESHPSYVFNHNEVTLYKWVQEYEPLLFERIRKLVKAGQWHIMGGWFLQPDCNMPSGESFVRQILLGYRYFKENFDVEPSTAINFDPFGHTRGLVQILRKSGYDSYIFCRPFPSDIALPAENFIWVGYDESEITAHRSFDMYMSHRGMARDKTERFMNAREYRTHDTGLVLWGIGNHGGGPSKLDLERLGDLIAEQRSLGVEVGHSTPEAYFAELDPSALPRHKGDLNPWGPGCYTSQIRLKQKHRKLENEYYMTEKMCSAASVQGLMKYPSDELYEALCDLMNSEFHDILPGSSIQPVEETSIRLMDHGLEILSRIKARAFFALASGQGQAEEETIPVFVYNPHPYEVEGIVECEFQLADQNRKGGFYFPYVYQYGESIPCQVEKEVSNHWIDWRKRSVFRAVLKPGRINRFDCKLVLLEEKPKSGLKEIGGYYTVTTSDLEISINARTGWMDRFVVNGHNYMEENGCRALVIQDNDDPWGMTVKKFATQIGEFSLMNAREGTEYSGVTGDTLQSVRVIEDGDVRTVIEALFRYGNSFLCQTYKIPKKGTEVEVQLRVQWNEKSKFLKWSLPTTLHGGKYRGQVAYGVETLPADRTEVVAQKWTGMFDSAAGRAFTCVNDGVYGSDCENGHIRVSLLRSPSYSGHPCEDRPDEDLPITPQDRFTPRIDQGERLYTFWLKPGAMAERERTIDREALSHNERPYALSFFPSGAGTAPKPLVELSDSTVLLTTFKRSEQHADEYVVRLFNPAGSESNTVVTLPAFGVQAEASLKPYEIRTYICNRSTGVIAEADLKERAVSIE